LRVLFVYSGNLCDTNSLITNQGESLVNEGVIIDYFIIRGKGFIGYLKNLPSLRNTIKKGKYDLVHAHYSFSGYLAGLSTLKPIIVSLMGSDIHKNIILRSLTRFFYSSIWTTTIVKSNNMKMVTGLKKAIVIPNGINIEKFKPIDKNDAQKIVGYDSSKKHIIFVSDPRRKEKNYSLALEGYKMLDNDQIEFHVVYNVPHDKIPVYMYAADLLLLTSLWEGSPNVVKEALACNLPVVSTDVGDVMERIKGLKGCYIISDDPNDIAEKIKMAIQSTSSIRNYTSHSITDTIIAKKLTDIYNNILYGQ
jgi:teichuronic acid biosynthesis glycosyltransferase TuaC